MRWEFFLLIILLIIPAYAQEDSAFGKPLERTDYTISRSHVERILTKKTLFQDYLDIYTTRQGLKVDVSVSGNAQEIITLESKGVMVSPGSPSRVYFTIVGKEVGTYSGSLELTGDVKESIPINISVISDNLYPRLSVKVSTSRTSYTREDVLKIKVDVLQLVQSSVNNVSFTYALISQMDNKSYFLENESFDTINTSFQLVKEYEFPVEVAEGDYYFEAIVDYPAPIARSQISRAEFFIRKPFLQYSVGGVIPLWMILVLLGALGLGIFVFWYVRRMIRKKKKYKVDVDFKTLPKKDDGFFKFGKIAETNLDAYFDPNNLLTHTIVAGATGGGKSIAAQVIVEEALMKNVAVIVFDPTAQWSGMLRKGDDKRMFDLYPRFGLKPGDARAFNGNVRQIQDSREYIDLNKYMVPGQIQIFAMNRLPPEEIDTFVASTIVSIFRSNLQEFPNLRVLLVFDEVHRLLSKFGGSGAGFLQIERACREFRKWGLGLILVSQVLSDFVSAIKANITTEAQMRTRDEGDLQRINVKYGEHILQSLVKASVGTGMLVNPKYNRGRPYFVTFRPILHSTKRLSDQELEKYNSYNLVYDEMEYQVEQLEKEGIDIFDFKMELKLVLDKLKAGNFSVVDIYLEGLKPRLESTWKKLGKTPKKKELVLVDVSAIKKSVEEAKKAREEWEKKVGGGKKAEEQKVVEEDISVKIVPSITLDNGIMLSSLKEFKEVLDVLDDGVFAIHVNKDKNDLAEWVGKNIDSELGEFLKGMKTKADGVKIIDTWMKKRKEGKDKKEEKKEEKKDEGGEEKKE